MLRKAALKAGADRLTFVRDSIGGVLAPVVGDGMCYMRSTIKAVNQSPAALHMVQQVMKSNAPLTTETLTPFMEEYICRHPFEFAAFLKHGQKLENMLVDWTSDANDAFQQAFGSTYQVSIWWLCE